MNDERLAAFQAALAELFARELAAEEILAALATDPAFAPYRDYVRAFEPRLIEATSMLSRRWGQRS